MLWALPLAGAAAGALLNKKSPLKGAAIGGLLGAGGAYAAPSVMGSSAAGGSLTGGLLNFSGTQVAAPIADMSVKASPEVANAVAGGGLSTFTQYAQPASLAMNIAGQAHQMGQTQPVQPPQMQPMQPNPQAFAGLLSPSQQYDPLKRQQAQQMAVQGLLGGYRG